MPSGKAVADAAQSAPDLEIVGDQVTLQPSGFTGGPEPHDHGITERNLVRHMARFRENPFDFLREVSLFVSGTGWRAYEDVIGQPIFYAGFSDRMKNLILANPLLRDKIKELAEVRLEVEAREGLLNANMETFEQAKVKRKKEIEDNLKEVVDTMMDNMICKMESNKFIRGAYYLCTQLLTRAYHQGELPWEENRTRARLVAYVRRDSCLQ